MKILLVSDSHGNNEALDLIVKKHPNMDLYLHLGDSESDEFLIKPFISVRGNCDSYPDFQNKLLIPTPLGNILAVHEPYISKNEITANNTKFLIHGHTHRRKYEDLKDYIVINPGSISFSRDGNELSYAILKIINDNFELNFYTIN